MRRVARALRAVVAILRLLLAVTAILASFLWKRYWAVRTFERTLRRAGLPRDVAREFTRGYRRMANLTSGRRNLNRKKV
ncbi:hypothetical protein LR032_04775 [Candidatus Bipolaricaulota bacterium]|nr:hypothetical protein [Candidatus Bipolaricaulota bacterium]